MTPALPLNYSEEILLGIVPVQVSVVTSGLDQPLCIDAVLDGQCVRIAGTLPLSEAALSDLQTLVARLSIEVCEDEVCSNPRIVVEDDDASDGLCGPCHKDAHMAAFEPGGAFDQFAAKHSHRVRLTSVTHSPSLSEETEAFAAKLSWDGQDLGRVSNAGRGGCNDYDADVRQINAELGQDPVFDGDLDVVVGRALVEHNLRRDAQRRFGKGDVGWLVSRCLPSLGGSEGRVKWPEVLQTWQIGGKEQFVAEALKEGWVVEADLPRVIWFPDVYLAGNAAEALAAAESYSELFAGVKRWTRKATS